MIFKKLLYLLLILTVSCSKDNLKQLSQPESIIKTLNVTDMGSSRANAYEMYNRFIYGPGAIYFSYLDSESENQKVKIASISDSKELTINYSASIGTSKDNHGGATIVIDSKNRVHVFYGAHNSPLKYRRINDLSNSENWSKEKSLGNGITYPSAVINSKDEIFLIYRYGFNIYQENPWEYRLMKIGKEEILFDKTILISRSHENDFVDRYINYFAQLSIDSNDNLHLAYILHERSSDDPVIPKNGIGYGIGYLTSSDEGDSWKDYKGEIFNSGISVSKPNLIRGQKEIIDINYDFRSVSLSVNPQTNSPSIGYTFYDINKKNWKTHIIKEEFSGWKDRFVADDLYKISYMNHGEGEYLIGEKLYDLNSSVEQGWSNNNTTIVLRRIENNGSYENIFESDNTGEPAWYPSFPKDYNTKNKPKIASYMIGNIEGSSKVKVIRF
jgi:hypothetical protein